jgi:hypothetical protein
MARISNESVREQRSININKSGRFGIDRDHCISRTIAHRLREAIVADLDI